jgi:hypothetical protein
MKTTKQDKKLYGLNKTDTKVMSNLLDNKSWIFSQIIKLWNEDTPHFRGDGAHRYDDNSISCSYCGRPKNWKPRNAQYEITFRNGE